MDMYIRLVQGENKLSIDEILRQPSSDLREDVQKKAYVGLDEMKVELSKHERIPPNVLAFIMKALSSNNDGIASRKDFINIAYLA